jgi:putative flippase GtrA
LARVLRRETLSHLPNWLQLGRFLVVGASGFAINIVLYAILIHGVQLGYILAAVISNLVALVNNFLLHRHWTFAARDAEATHQAVRFVLVCAVGFAINLVVLRLGVEVVGIPKLPAEAIAAVTAAPVTFLLNRQWAFRRREPASVAS